MHDFFVALSDTLIQGLPFMMTDASIEQTRRVKFEVFINKAKEQNILILKKDKPCDVKSSFWSSKKTYIADDSNINDAYLELYNHLVKREIIYEKPGIKSLINGNKIYNVNLELIETNNLKDTIDKDLPNLLKCYDINYDSLSKFIKSYTHKILGGKKTNKGYKNKRRTRKRL